MKEMNKMSEAKATLVGNPNSGKTTLFNVLTGTHQRVGNWPGVTVEQKTGTVVHPSASFEIVDLPGTYSITDAKTSLDEQIAQDYLHSKQASVIINIVDASTLSRSLLLTSELAELELPMVVALNMTDVAKLNGIEIDPEKLAQALGCPVVPIVAAKKTGIDELVAALNHAVPSNKFASGDATNRFAAIDKIVDQASVQQIVTTSVSEKIDNVVLHPIWAFPIFLGVMYLMFLLSINVGSAFIDFFDLVGAALFVELPRLLFESVGLPGWLTIFLADGVGGGVQLVGTFIPVIGALFLVLAALEDSGYMARVAFIVDRLLRRLGLPGKSFVPLIVGFGCNVPAVMATRTLDSQPDRILTTLMAPFMSCGARLTVYALFAAAFFPQNGQNIVFALYLIGIAVAVLSALAVKKHLLPETRSHFVLELPTYHMPRAQNIAMQAWQRLKGFVLRAGKAIVLVVIALNVLNSIGTDGSVGNENTEQSVLSEIGKTLTPAFAPIGISEDNWPATVGIFTGLFAKEVVVGTLDALYAPAEGGSDESIADMVLAGLESIPANLKDLGGQLGDPLGLDLGDTTDLAAQADEQEVQLNTLSAMQNLFDGQLGAFAYLLFILLYAPCVATIGVIYKEIGTFWAVFSVVWSFAVGYGLAAVVYQAGQISTTPAPAFTTLAIVGVVFVGLFIGLIQWGKRQESVKNLIPIKIIE